MESGVLRRGSSRLQHGCDRFGERLAFFLAYTTPPVKRDVNGVLALGAVLVSAMASSPVGMLFLPVIWWKRRYARILTRIMEDEAEAAEPPRASAALARAPKRKRKRRKAHAERAGAAHETMTPEQRAAWARLSALAAVNSGAAGAPDALPVAESLRLRRRHQHRVGALDRNLGRLPTRHLRSRPRLQRRARRELGPRRRAASPRAQKPGHSRHARAVEHEPDALTPRRDRHLREAQRRSHRQRPSGYGIMRAAFERAAARSLSSPSLHASPW